MKLEVLEINENENGTCDVVFDYDDEYYEFMKKEMGDENPSDEKISSFLSETLEKAVKLFKESKQQEG